MNELAVILPAGGSSTRFGRNKLLEPIGGEAVLIRTVRCFDGAGKILIATGDPATTKILDELPASVRERVKVCPGGETRADSVLSALRHVPDHFEWVAIHDAARPMVSADLIHRTYAAAKQHGAAAPAMAVSLTIKQAAGPLPAPVQRTVPRHQLWAMQTPQVFRRVDLLDAYERCPIALDKITDDAQLLELAGKTVILVPGEESNLKITTQLDLRLVQLLLEDRV